MHQHGTLAYRQNVLLTVRLKVFFFFWIFNYPGNGKILKKFLDNSGKFPESPKSSEWTSIMACYLPYTLHTQPIRFPTLLHTPHISPYLTPHPPYTFLHISPHLPSHSNTLPHIFHIDTISFPHLPPGLEKIDCNRYSIAIFFTFCSSNALEFLLF